MKIGLLGAASIDNAGDVLVAVAVRDALAARFPDAELGLSAGAGADGPAHS